MIVEILFVAMFSCMLGVLIGVYVVGGLNEKALERYRIYFMEAQKEKRKYKHRWDITRKSENRAQMELLSMKRIQRAVKIEIDLFASECAKEEKRMLDAMFDPWYQPNYTWAKFGVKEINRLLRTVS